MRKIWLMRLLALLIVADIAAGAVWTMMHYVYIGGELVPRDTTCLDLQDQELTVEEYLDAAEKLPDCEILWSVPLKGGKIPSTQTEITVKTLTDEDVKAIASMPKVSRVDGTGCTNYPQLMQLQQLLPECEVTYYVNISGEAYAQDTRKITAAGFTEEDAANLAYLPELSQVKVTACDDYSLLEETIQAHPEWNMSYTVSIGGEEFASDVETVTVSGAEIEDLTRGLPGLPGLKTLNLQNPVAEAEELLKLREKYPQLDIHWEVEIFGKTVGEDTKELDLSGIPVGSCQEVERLVACLPNLEKLIMSDCGIDSETMAAFRERQRENYKVVWTVHLSDKSECRTDAIYFMPTKQGEYYFLDKHSKELKYCEDIICLDLGHHKITNIDFVEYMPKLKYLVIAHTEVQDVSPIVHCQELVYLEVDWSTIKDYSPIAELKKLEDLNLNETYCDLTPIMEMTWLETLWMPGRGYEWGQKMTEALPNTRVQLQKTAVQGEMWRNLQNYYDMRDILGMPYMYG